MAVLWGWNRSTIRGWSHRRNLTRVERDLFCTLFLLLSRRRSSSPCLSRHAKTKLMFEVDDLEAKMIWLESEGVTIVVRPWGACDVIDPEGNIFQIFSSTKKAIGIDYKG
jgi:hypothetical protein